MTAAWEASGTGVLTATSGAACTPGIPAGTGKVLIAHVFYGGNTTSPDTPADWTLLDGPRELNTPATNGRVWVFGKVAVGGDANPAFGTQAVTTPRRARVYRFTGALNDVIGNIVGGFDFGTGTTTPCTDTAVTTGADAQDYLAVNLIAGADDTLAPGDFTGETGGDWTTPAGSAAHTGTTGTPDTWMNLQTAVVAPSTTINGGSAATTANDPWGVTGFYIRSKPPKDTAPSLVATATSGYNATSPKQVGSSMSWETGDEIYVIGQTGGVNTTLGTPTIAGLSGTGLTFNPIGTNPLGGANNCLVYKWKATATGAGSGTVQGSATAGTDDWGIRAWQYRGSDGTGATASLVDTAHTITLACSDDHSAVIAVFADWDGTAPPDPATWSPTGVNERDRVQTGGVGIFTAYAADWGDQGTASSDAYGPTNAGSTGTWTKFAVEVTGSITGGAVEGTATQDYGYAGTAAGQVTVQGSAAGDYGWAGAAAGGGQITGSAASDYPYTGAAAGQVTAQGSAASDYGWAGAAAGQVTVTGTAASTYGYAGVAAGQEIPAVGFVINVNDADSWIDADFAVTGDVIGSAAGDYGYTGAAIGEATVEGSATSNYPYAGTASGQVWVLGSATADYGYTGTAAGGGLVQGSASGDYSYTGAATGQVTVTGSAAGDYGYAGAGAGQVAVQGTATALYDYAGTAVGSIAGQGTAAGNYSYLGDAAGQTWVIGSAAGDYGYTGSAAGQVTVAGTATGLYSYAGTASGSAIVLGSAGQIYGWAGTAAGQTGGIATNTYGYTGSAAGQVTVVGTASGLYIWAGVSAAQVTALGAAAAVHGYLGGAAGVVQVDGTAAGDYLYAGAATSAVPQRTRPIMPSADLRTLQPVGDPRPTQPTGGLRPIQPPTPVTG